MSKKIQYYNCVSGERKKIKINEDRVSPDIFFNKKYTSEELIKLVSDWINNDYNTVKALDKESKLLHLLQIVTDFLYETDANVQNKIRQHEEAITEEMEQILRERAELVEEWERLEEDWEELAKELKAFGTYDESRSEISELDEVWNQIMQDREEIAKAWEQLAEEREQFNEYMSIQSDIVQEQFDRAEELLLHAQKVKDDEDYRCIQRENCMILANMYHEQGNESMAKLMNSLLRLI